MNDLEMTSGHLLILDLQMNDLEMTSGHLLILANLHVKFEDSRSKHTKVIPWNKNFNIFTFKVTVTLTFKWMTLKWPVVTN